MSFILDALKKSDQQRQRNATPTLATAQVPAAAARQPALLWYGLVAAVLLAAGMFIGWMHQTPAEAPMPALHAAPAVQSVVAAPLAAVPEQARKPDMPAPPKAALAAAPAPVPPMAAAPKESPANPPAGNPSAALAPGMALATKPEEHPKKVDGDGAKEPEPMAMAELPPAIQQELPKLAILAHSYSSKPQARFVFINDRMLHEDESPAPGLKLEQITRDGMVFSYKGYRFRRAANQ